MPTRRFLNSLLVSFLLGVTINAADFTEQGDNLLSSHATQSCVDGALCVNPKICGNGARCRNPNCPDIHDCTHKAKCFNFYCNLRHPPHRLNPCRNGATCNKGKDCPYLHPSKRQREKKNSPRIKDDPVETDSMETIHIDINP